MNDYIEDAENICLKLVELEDRLRRNNIRIDGIKEHNKESWDQCERRVHSMLKKRLDIENVEIERAHRAGRKSGSKPRTIVCKLRKYRKELWEGNKVLRRQGKITYLNYRSIVSRYKVLAFSSETEISEYEDSFVFCFLKMNR